MRQVVRPADGQPPEVGREKHEGHEQGQDVEPPLSVLQEIVGEGP